MIEQPKERSVSNAIETLTKLNILDENENLTPLRIRIMYFSMDVRYSKALILSCIFQCLSPILSLITMLSTTTEMNTTSLMSKSVKKDIKHTFHSTSDHIALIRYFRNSVSDQQNSTEFHNNADKNDNSQKLWSMYNINDLISSKVLLSADDCEHLNTNAKHSELLRAILFSASNQLLNVKPFGFKRGTFTKTINTIVSEKNTTVAISPDSVNSKRKNWPSPFLMYFHQIGQDGRKSSISDTSLLSPLSVVLFSQNEITCDWVSEENVVMTMKDFQNVRLYCDKRTAELLLEFRGIFWKVTNYVIQHLTEKNNNDVISVYFYKEKMLRLVIKIINESAKNIDKPVVVKEPQQETTSSDPFM
ncbi:ATP-dependent RNA helicase DHX30-like [Nomia melanderi]|uniref:ATP-dependent RNA helicase DHX30-like n=1 Tax=Nomia melanderi TaxID=2448451 RepID=UPI003FCEDA92